MHMYDPNGSIRAYRIARNRRETGFAILFGIGIGCALLFVTCGVLVLLSAFGK